MPTDHIFPDSAARAAEAAESERLEINLGPSHPSTHGVLRVRLELDGEVVTKADPVVGYLHRGDEKIAENMTYNQFVPYTDRLDYLAPLANNVAYAIAVEKLARLEVPERCQAIRVISCELARISSHLLGLGAYGIDVGAWSVFLYSFTEREKLYKLFEELTGARFLVDQITTACALESLARGKAKGLPVTAPTSINHLSFNEVDIGDYRTFLKFDPPVRSEDDRQATIEALASGLIDIVVSAHAPAPAEDKRLPFDEAAPGAVGLQTLLPALLSFQDRIPLIDLMRTVTSRPAELLGLPAGRLAKGAPADLVLCDLNAPMVVDLDKLRSKSRNSPFDGRRLFGEVRMTLVDGRVVYQA